MRTSPCANHRGILSHGYKPLPYPNTVENPSKTFRSMAALWQPLTNRSLLKPESSCIFLLERCRSIQELKQIHVQMIKTGLVLDTISASRLLTALCSSPQDSSRLIYARLFFDRTNQPNTFMWNTMIRACSNNKNHQHAMLLYCQMLCEAVPHNSHTYPFLLKGFNNLEEAQQIHCHAVKTGFAKDIYTANSLLRVYNTLGSTDSARRLFDRILCRDTVSWNTMIDGYAKSRRIDMARQLFDLMQTKNVISWTTMITGYVESCQFKEALEVFQAMQATETEPDAVVLASTLSACAQLAALDQGRRIHAYIKKKEILLDAVLGCVLVDMYAKCGDLREALAVFEQIQEKNVSVWTAMINGFALHGRGMEALSLFRDMEESGIKPNSITFTSVLTACSHAGIVEEGRSFWVRIVEECSTGPSMEHYGCMVDLLGRAGLLREAEGVIATMPMMPNAAVWGALLNACLAHRDFELGRRVGEILIELEPNHCGRYIQLASILAAQGNWDGAARVRKQMKERKISKLPGRSSISLNGRVHEFLAGDWSHQQAAEIYLQWDRIQERLKEEGYEPVIEDLLLDLEDEEKETAVNCHSEKLAIVFGLMKTEKNRTIRIVKNLRVCRDCHTVTKLISKVYGRKIIMRDRSRFHHFEDGRCSCRDYW